MGVSQIDIGERHFISGNSYVAINAINMAIISFIFKIPSNQILFYIWFNNCGVDFMVQYSYSDILVYSLYIGPVIKGIVDTSSQIFL